jgi:hypothetical protein
MFGKIKAMMLFSRHVEWVDEPKWEREDSERLTSFLTSHTGKKLSLILRNMVVRGNARCVQSKKDLEFEAGFANGFRGAVTSIESLANSEFYEAQESPLDELEQ